MPELTILFDGGCPLCVREVTFLERRDRRLTAGQRQPRLAFVDINAADYDPSRHAGISYRQAMGRIHAIDGAGRVLRDVAVFREAYRLIGLGWLYAPSRWRLALTGRPSLDALCQERCQLPQQG